MVQVVAMVLMCAVLGVAAYTDIQSRKIYNWLTYPAVLAGVLLWLGWAAASGDFAVVAGRFGLGLAAGIVPFFALASIGAMNGGDAKLMAAVGALSASWTCVLHTFLYALIANILIALVVMIANGILLQTLQRVFYLLIASTSNLPTPKYEDSPKIPFAVAIALGGILAGSEVLLAVRWPWSHLMAM